MENGEIKEVNKGKSFVIDYPFDLAQDRFTIDD